MFKLLTTDHLSSKRCGKQNENSNLLRRNFPRGNSPARYAKKGELDPTLYKHMFEMQTMSNPKDKEQSLKNPMASSFKTCGGHKKLLGELCRSNSQKRPRLSNKGILKVSLISFGAALLLLYLLPGTLARYETSSFFPRLQYHKVPRLHFAQHHLNALNRRSEPLVHPRRHPNNEKSLIREQRQIRIPLNPSTLRAIRRGKPKPLALHHREIIKPVNDDVRALTKSYELIVAEPETTTTKSNKEEIAELPIKEKEPETTTLSKKSSELYPSFQYDTNDDYLSSEDYKEEPKINQIIPHHNSMPAASDAVYNSYTRFNPGQFKENSPEWQATMLHYLMDMRNNGHHIQEVSVDEPLPVLHRKLTQKETPDVSNSPGTEDIKVLSPDQVKSNEEKTKHEHSSSLSRNTLAEISGSYESPVICKLEPYNLCYRFDKEGNLHPIGGRRPVRLIRIY